MSKFDEVEKTGEAYRRAQALIEKTQGQGRPVVILLNRTMAEDVCQAFYGCSYDEYCRRNPVEGMTYRDIERQPATF